MGDVHMLEGSRYQDRTSPTPLVAVRLDPASPGVWCKLEYMNPSGSLKDRIARYILGKAWQDGRITSNSIVVEASSGSTSIAMALTCAQLGLRFRAVMPEGVSGERLLCIRAYGGEVVTTPKSDGVRGALLEAERMALQDSRVFLPRQFQNPENTDAHRLGTAQEILEQLPRSGPLAVVSGVGTGGTLMGLCAGLKEAGCEIIPVMARPIHLLRTPELECCSFSDRIPGVVDRLSVLFDEALLPGLVTIEVEDREALDATRALIQLGFPVGPSSGLNYLAAARAALQLKRPDVRFVTVFPDRMERYFTTELFAPYVSA